MYQGICSLFQAPPRLYPRVYPVLGPDGSLGDVFPGLDTSTAHTRPRPDLSTYPLSTPVCRRPLISNSSTYFFTYPLTPIQYDTVLVYRFPIKQEHD